MMRCRCCSQPRSSGLAHVHGHLYTLPFSCGFTSPQTCHCCHLLHAMQLSYSSIIHVQLSLLRNGQSVRRHFTALPPTDSQRDLVRFFSHMLSGERQQLPRSVLHPDMCWLHAGQETSLTVATLSRTHKWYIAHGTHTAKHTGSRLGLLRFIPSVPCVNVSVPS